jgi:hypothetical protein
MGDIQDRARVGRKDSGCGQNAPMTPEMVRRRLVVHGKVQGVFYRLGPISAQVTGVEETEEQPEGLTAFETR